MSTTTVTFDRITWTGVVKDKCTNCGKRCRRQRQFGQTQNPFNKHKGGPFEGRVKTYGEILEAVREQANQWERDYVLLCTACEEGGLEAQARAYVTGLVNDGKATDLMMAYSDHNQSCAYVMGIVEHVAQGGSTMSAQDFARSLLEDWSK